MMQFHDVPFDYGEYRFHFFCGGLRNVYAGRRGSGTQIRTRISEAIVERDRGDIAVRRRLTASLASSTGRPGRTGVWRFM